MLWQLARMVLNVFLQQTADSNARFHSANTSTLSPASSSARRQSEATAGRRVL